MYSLHDKKNVIYANVSVFVYPEVFPQPAGSRPDPDLTRSFAWTDDNAVLKCQLASPYGGSLSHSADKAL